MKVQKDNQRLSWDDSFIEHIGTSKSGLYSPVNITGRSKAVLLLQFHLSFFVIWCASNEATFIEPILLPVIFCIKKEKR